MKLVVLTALSTICLVLAACGSDSATGDAQGGGDAADASVSDSSDADTAGQVPETLSESVTEIDLGIDSCCSDDWFDVTDSDLGKACAKNEDCVSGLCLDTPGGSVCTTTCVEDCPYGWQCKGVSLYGSDPVFLCVPMYWSLCAECMTAADCGMPESGCVSVENEGTFCSVPCLDDADCPADFSCEEADTQSPNWCLPKTKTCRCNAKSAGVEEPCKVKNQFGACEGTHVCQGETGWGECSADEPAAEKCDGEDNNCDGDVDEAFPDLGKPCDGSDQDSCEMGTWTCSPEGTAVVCVNEAETDIQEVCDGKDNDCDGDKDEGFPEVGFPCDSDDSDLCKKGTWTCALSGLMVECVNETETHIEDVCDGKDNDCDGKADQDYPLAGLPCDSPDTDYCENGTWTCTPEGTDVECVNESQIDIYEICNYSDDDCDGEVDEGFPGIGTPCDGVDSDFCANGTLTCTQDGAGLECVNEVPVNIPEVCGGGDEDCDGILDPEGAQGCTVYYADGDNDGYGSASAGGKCLCSQQPPYKVTSSTDCYDANPSAHPDQGGWFTSHRGDGSFDYDCSGFETKESTAVASNCVLSLEICTGTGGWSGSVPACGQQGKMLSNCHWVFDPFGGKVGCYFDEAGKTQGCH